jgi:DNA-binding transcriptional LysR family regulator
MVRIELKHMEAAAALAEELNFSRAAGRLHVSQPAVTKYIAELEDSVGVLLFLRDRRSVALTEAGRAFVEEARIALLHSERAIHASRAAELNSDLILNVGRTPYADPYFTSMLLATRLPLFPRLRLNLSSGFCSDLTHEVLTGELDLAVVIEPTLSARLTGLKIDESPLYVVISREDELAEFPSVQFSQLALRPWILFQRHSHPPLYDGIQKQARELGVTPSTLQHFLAPEEALPLMENLNSVVIVGKSGALRIARDGLTMRPLEDARLMTKTLLISRADNGSKAVSELFRAFVRRTNQIRAENQMSLPLHT